MKDEAAAEVAPEAGAAGEATPPARRQPGGLRRFLRKLRKHGYLTAALPVLATFATILLFLYTYSATYECRWGCQAKTEDNKYPKSVLFACCEKPYFTDLFNTLQAKNGF